MADLTTALQTHHQAVDDFVAAAGAVPPVKGGEARAAGGSLRTLGAVNLRRRFAE